MVLIKKPTKTLTERQQDLLGVIIEKYIENNIAISSLNLKKQNLFNRSSSATIRNEMVILENLGYLKKEYSSSGRIPTKMGYQIYIEMLMKNWKFLDMDIKNRLSKILANRNESIDITIDKSIELISNFINLPIIVTKSNKVENEILKKIDITQIMDNQFIIFLVTSLGEIYKNEITIDEFVQREDLNICVRLLNDHLINTPVSKISEKIQEIIPELRRNIHQYEFIYTVLISKLLDRAIINSPSMTKIYNSKSIISQPEVKNNLIDINEIFYLLDNYSTLSQINFHFLKTGNTLINLENNIDGLSLATTTVDSQNNTHKLTIIGPNRMNYPLIKYLLEFINEKIVNNK